MMAELAFTQPLAHPDHFEQAHRITMRALEVADRQGWKNPKVPNLGPLRSPAQAAIEFVSRTIVRAYVARVIRSLAMLISSYFGVAVKADRSPVPSGPTAAGRSRASATRRDCS